MYRPQLTVRPGQELLREINDIGEKYALTNAEVCRQLMVFGLDEYRKGKRTIQPIEDHRSSRLCGQAISIVKRGRSTKETGVESMYPATLGFTPAKDVMSDE